MVYGVYTMERFQIYLAKGQRNELERLARSRGCNVSQVVREAIDALVALEASRGPAPLERIEDHPLWGLVGMIKEDGGKTTYGSTTYKEDLYGDKRGPWPVSS